MKIVSKEPSKTVPSIKDTFKMAVTSFDDKARDYQTFDMEFVAPCLVKWGIPPWGVVSAHPFPSPRCSIWHTLCIQSATQMSPVSSVPNQVLVAPICFLASLSNDCTWHWSVWVHRARE